MTPEDLTSLEKTRLMMAARIAAGMCANPETYRQSNWEGETARAAMVVANRLISLAMTGGCL